MNISAEDRARIKSRYPTHGTGTVMIVTFAGIITMVGLIWLIWVAAYHANPALDAHVSRYEIESDYKANASVVVQRNDPSVSGSCLVVAQAETFDRVAEIDLEIPAGGEELTTFEVELKTLKRATSVSIASCHSDK